MMAGQRGDGFQRAYQVNCRQAAGRRILARNETDQARLTAACRRAYDATVRGWYARMSPGILLHFRCGENRALHSTEDTQIRVTAACPCPKNETCSTDEFIWRGLRTSQALTHILHWTQPMGRGCMCGVFDRNSLDGIRSWREHGIH